VQPKARRFTVEELDARCLKRAHDYVERRVARPDFVQFEVAHGDETDTRGPCELLLRPVQQRAGRAALSGRNHPPRSDRAIHFGHKSPKASTGT
jgi:hypothetical protein